MFEQKDNSQKISEQLKLLLFVSQWQASFPPFFEYVVTPSEQHEDGLSSKTLAPQIVASTPMYRTTWFHSGTPLAARLLHQWNV